MTLCPLCKSALTATITSWSFHCKACDHWVSTFSPPKAVIENSEFDAFDVGENTIDFLDSVRRATTGTILSELKKYAGRKLLDVGCAAGLFVEVAAENGFDAYGIEPNKKMAEHGIKRGLRVRTGFFPEALTDDERFDVIAFNDVLEHIEDVHFILAGCHEKLTRGGHLCINVPNSGGLFFRLARLLGAVGFNGPWNRLWQTMFYTPHLHYFSAQSLTRFAAMHNFTAAGAPMPLPVLAIAGLWKRISLDPDSSLVKNIAVYVCILLIFPLYLATPKDSFFMIFQKREKA